MDPRLRVMERFRDFSSLQTGKTTCAQRDHMEEKSVSHSIPKGITYTNAHTRMHTSADRCKQNTSDTLITVRQATMEALLLGNSGEVAVVGTTISTCGRDRSSTEMADAETEMMQTGENWTARTGVQTDTMDIREETEVVTEATEKQPTPHTPKTESGKSAENTPTKTEVGYLEHMRHDGLKIWIIREGRGHM